MILTKEVQIKITPCNIDFYINLGYDKISFNKRIIVPIEHLLDKSNAKIFVKCDICGKEKI